MGKFTKFKDQVQLALIEGAFFNRGFRFLGQSISEGVRRLGKWISQGVKDGIGKIDLLLERLYLRHLSKKIPVVPRRVVFMTFQNTYTCNPKYICEQLLADDPDIECVWVVNQATINNPAAQGIPECVKLVKRGHLNHYRALLSANVWVDNALNCCWRDLPKKKGQYYINTWHGSLGIKRLDTYNPNKGYWISRARASNTLIDYMLVNSDFEQGVFSGAYWPDVEMVRYGHPRNDMFFDDEMMGELRRKVFEHFGLDEDVRIALYAPTFREDKSVKPINLDCGVLQQALEERFGGTWRVLLRLHMHNRGKAREVAAREPGVVDATAYPDIQELMVAADVGVTDYSSWIYDFMLTRRPCFIYASDLEKYNTVRGFCYPLETTPFPIARNTEAMRENVLAFDEEAYAKALEEFLAEKGCMEDGHAAERTSALIRELLDRRDE